MTPLRPAKRLKSPTDTTIVLETSPASRLIYGVLFIVLIVALVTNVDLSRDFTGNRLVGTVVFLAILVGLLGVCLSVWRMVADRGSGVIVIQRALVVMVIRQRRIEMDRVRSLLLRRAVVIKGSGPSGKGADSLQGGSSLFGRGRRIRQREFVSLHLVTDEGELTLDSATDPGALRKTGTRLAEFLGVPLEEVET